MNLVRLFVPPCVTVDRTFRTNKSAAIDMNTPATNFNVSITDLRREDQTLVAAIDPLLDDADGAGLLQYQWQRSDGSGGWSDIAGATATFYTLDDPDVGHEVRLKVYFVDGGGTTENQNRPSVRIDIKGRL